MPAIDPSSNKPARVRSAAPRKVRRVKPASSAPPRSPDSIDNTRIAREPKPIAHPSPDAQDVTARSPQQKRHDAKFVADTAKTERRAAVVHHRQHAVRQFVTGQGASGHQLASLPARAKLAAAITDVAGVLPGSHQHVAHLIEKAAKNAPKDAAELAVTTPSSVAHLAGTAVHHPGQLPGMLAQPYKELLNDPEKFITEHPVSSALMVAPGVRLPGRIVGRVTRLTGKQTLERPSAALPGTALKKARTGSRDALVRVRQARQDAKEPKPVMTQADIQQRVDEFHHFSGEHRRRVEAAATRQAKERGLKGDAQAQHVSGALGAVPGQLDRRFGEEFGATHEISPQGHIVQPKGATKGVIHESRTDAQRIADQLNARGTTIARGSSGPHLHARRNVRVPLEFKVHEIGDQGAGFAVVPKAAAETLVKHAKVGSAGAPGSKIMRVAGKTFRTAVLPLSMRWLAGQGIEAGLRAFVAKAGPADWVRFQRVVRKMNEEHPGSGDELMMRVVHGGHFGLTGTAREFAHGKNLADEFEGTALEDIGHGLTRVGNVKPARAVRSGWEHYTNAVMGVVNGSIERTARKAMAGQAIRQGQLMERHIIGHTDRAIADAARGLHATENQVQLGRELDRMYGQYQKFSWQKRETLLHTTPFYPWYRNVATFLLKVLPVDHPVTAAVIAALDATTEDWRKAHGLSFHGQAGLHAGKPGFLLGGVPVGNGERVVRVGRYTPFAPGDTLASAADLVTPQFGNVKEILKGVDWKGGKVKGNIPLVAVKTLAEAHIPGLAQADRITGLGGHYIDKTGENTVLDGKQLLPALRREFDPLISTRGHSSATTTASSSSGPAVRVTRVRVKPIRVKPIKVKPVRVR